ncbi:hypothetical protein LCGC14_2075710 [marine sediment metagenome]|uniref:Uncharacterized protein n=2 Tax=root TaxID=1 RepID=A0A831QKB8_9FLAO|nr:hypothetical protein [Pricia antarctica]
MENFRPRPKGNYIESGQWQELYTLTVHWKSDLLFYKDDLKFLRHLVDKYFIWVKNQDNLDGVQKVGEAILKDIRECDQLLRRVSKHLSHLARIIDEPFKNDSQLFRKEHAELEDDIARFIKNVRKERKHLFKITEHVMDKEKLEHHLKD